MNNLISLKFLSKKLPKSSPSSTLTNFCRLYHSLSKINTHNLPNNNKNSQFLSPLHQWRSSYSGFFHAFPKHSVSSAHFNKAFLGCSGFRFSTTHCSENEPSQLSLRISARLKMPWFLPPWILWFERQGYSAKGVLYSLIFANVAVFLMWQVFPQDFMYRHFTLSLDNLLSGRIYTLLTCAFSHFDTVQFVSNMIGLFYFGKAIGKLTGSVFLLFMYLFGALSGCSFYALQSLLRWLLQLIKNQEISGVDPLLGASGAVNGMVLAMLLFPVTIFFQMFIIPMPAMILGSFVVGVDLLRILQGDPNGGSAQMLGAALVAGSVKSSLRFRS